jgi:hypothetical protein
MPHPQIALVPVTSSQLHSIGHDADTNTLAIRFKGKNGPGSLYHYKNLTKDDFAAFSNAESKGSFFKSKIKIATDSYPFTKIDETAVATPPVEALAPGQVDAMAQADTDPAASA